MKQIVGKVILNGIGVLLIKSLGFILAIFISRNFGAESYGYYAYLVSFLVLLGTTFSNIMSQSFSLETYNNGFDKLIFLITYTLFCFFICYQFFNINSYEFYISLIVIIFSTLPYSQLLKSENHKKISFISFIAVIAFFVSLVVCYSLGVNCKTYLIIYCLPYFFFLLFLLTLNDGLAISSKLGRNFFSHYRPLVFLYIGAAVVPLSYTLSYRLLIASGAKSTIGEFASIFQWVWLLGQLNIILNNVLIPMKNRLDGGPSNYINLNILFSTLPSIIIVSIIFPFSIYHNKIFGFNITSEDLRWSFFYVLSIAFLSSYKSHIYRNIVRQRKGFISFWSNLTWCVVFVSMNYISRDVDLLTICFNYFFSNLFSFLLFFPIFFKSRLVEFHSKNDIFQTLISFGAIMLVLIFGFIQNYYFLGMSLLGILVLTSYVFIKGKSINAA
jgi:hypothetical protein